MRIRAFDVRDEGLDADEVVFKINEQLGKLHISAADIVSITYPTDCAIARVFYKV